jgi:hypothetical protein
MQISEIMCWVSPCTQREYSYYLYCSKASTADVTFEPHDPKRKQAAVDVNRDVVE